jgi:hypothetical protein
MTVLKSRDTAVLPSDAPYHIEPTDTDQEEYASVSTIELTAMPTLSKIRKRLANGTVGSAEARRELSVRIPGLADDLKAAKAQIDRRRNQPR